MEVEYRTHFETSDLTLLLNLYNWRNTCL